MRQRLCRIQWQTLLLAMSQTTTSLAVWVSQTLLVSSLRVQTKLKQFQKAPIGQGFEADPDEDYLAIELERLMDEEDDAPGSQAAVIREMEIALDMLDDEVEVAADQVEAAPIVDPHDGPSSSAAGVACENEHGFEQLIKDLDLVDMSTGGKWVYRHTDDAKAAFSVHKIPQGKFWA